MSELIQPQAEPFLFVGDGVGCLLVHGFTGAPAEMRLLAQHLAAEGRTVLGPRLFGHGTNEADLDRAHYKDWLASAEDGYHMLKLRCDRIFIIGLSMGAVISLLLSTRLKVDGIVSLSTAYKLPDDPRVPLIRPISLVWKRLGKGESDWQDPAQQQYHFAYPHYPVPAVAELIDLLADMRQSLSEVSAPLLLMQSRRDGSLGVPANAMDSIAQAVSSNYVETQWLEHSGHVITLDAERELVFRRISQFIQRVLQENLDNPGSGEGLSE